MTTHDQHTEFTPTQDDSPQTPVDSAATPSSQATEPPPLETLPPATDNDTTVARESAGPSSERKLFADDELAGLRARWDSVQAAFVDDPRECVQKADSLVSDLVEQLTSGFTDARSRLEEQWARGEEASTEDLRVALKRYREFFERLLAV